MELAKTFDPKGMDQRWYDRWMEHKLFESKPDRRQPYTIVIPPPNVTGVLHVGHALNNTIQDILIRRARMQGKNACWVPGTDHASIATEAKVVGMLREKGIKKSDISREEFLKHAWEWKEKYGSIILEQLKKLGCSCDWSRTAFTMDPDYYQSVIRVFIDLYKKGYIYRGLRMIHWDPQAKTSLSDEEVIKKEVNSKLYYVRYKLESQEDFITIATVRPETILGDTAIAVNPKDERYKNLVGHFAFVPLIDRRIPIIADDYVEIEFGTGALKVTPAHDMNDYLLGLKHKLEVIDILNEDGTMSKAAQLYVGQDRFECRKNILKDLEANGHIVKIEDYTNQIGFSERTEAVVEPRLSMQWWCDMKKMAKPALKAVSDEEIKFYPKKFVNLYEHWMENIRDWCISRQLVWGHRIPAWYLPNGEFAVAETKEEAKEILKKRFRQEQKLKALSEDEIAKFITELNFTDNLRQDEDVLDTWFSSWLWPFEVFKGYSNPGNADVKYYYPTTTLVTAPEIIFFWVARMIMSGFEYLHEKPFSNVYFTGIVRDKVGRKMSKQYGNSPDLLELIDRYGADAVRFGILISSPAGNDLLFDEKLIEQGRNFNNKIWNALRLVKGWKIENKKIENSNSSSVDWFENKLNAAITEVERLFADFQISAALKILYSLVWDDFCSWYLEMIKPEFEKPIDQKTFDATIDFFERLMKVLHPFFPFVTEEIYHLLNERDENDFIMISKYPAAGEVDKEILSNGEFAKEATSSIRELMAKNSIKRSSYRILSIPPEFPEMTAQLIAASGSVNSITRDEENTKEGFPIIIDKFQLTLISDQEIDRSSEKSRLEKDLEYQRGFLESVMKKLSNEKFVANAKGDVIEKERKKADDAKINIRLIEERLATI